MRKISLLSFVVLMSLFLPSCLKDKLTKTYTIFEPVYRDKTEVLNDVKSATPRTVRDPGKIYKYGNYIFLNEINKGVHIIDNSDASNPVIKAFINIPGNLDIAVKGNILYADLFTDMLAINIADPLNASLMKMVTGVFPERQYNNGFIPEPGKIIVDWIEKQVTVRIPEAETRRAVPCRNCVTLQMSGSGSGGISPTVGAPAVGVAGSMARFAIVNDFLYAVNLHRLEVINIANPADPLLMGSQMIGMNIETIFPFRQKLFIGSSSGMFIYNINNPAAPVREGTFNHARACDPVVADANYAFVTLRAGNFCAGVNNQLDIINVQNVMAPILVKTYAMTNPFGLGKDGNLLFICDGKDGLKVYDASDVHNLRLLSHLRDLETYDVIVENNRLLLVAVDGLYQFDYSDPSNLRFLSKIRAY